MRIRLSAKNLVKQFVKPNRIRSNFNTIVTDKENATLILKNVKKHALSTRKRSAFNNSHLMVKSLQSIHL